MGGYVLDFSEIDQTQVTLVGGKGAHLGELARIAGLHVPAGFCVTTAAYRRILAAAPSLDAQLDQLARLQADNRDAIRALSGWPGWCAMWPCCSPSGWTWPGNAVCWALLVALSEAKAHWREFLSSLVSRGLSGLRLITSDAHEGLAAARRAVFGAVPWQRCQFHLQQNAQAYVPRQELKAEVAADIRAIFNAPDKAAVTLLGGAVSKYEKLALKLARWLEQNIPEG